jgi:hypothetical protein
MVRTELAVPAPGVTDPTENAQFKPLGQPITESEMGLLNDPDCVFAVTLRVLDWPAGMVSDEGDALNDRVEGRSPVLQAGVYCMAPDIWLTMPGFPTACTKSL